VAAGEVFADDDLWSNHGRRIGQIAENCRSAMCGDSAVRARCLKPIRLGGVVRWRLGEVKKWIAAGCPPVQARENEQRRT